jgi:mannitol-1-phosphate/altronate dehydrogenase
MSTPKAKIHPHLKSFIHSVVVAESGMGGTKEVKWKESLMRQIQGNVLERLEEIRTQTDLERITHEEVQKLAKDFSLTLDMVGRTLQQLPLGVLKQASPRR